MRLEEGALAAVRVSLGADGPKRQCFTCQFSEPTNRRATATPLPSANNHYGNCTLHGEAVLWDAGCACWEALEGRCLEYIVALNS